MDDRRLEAFRLLGIPAGSDRATVAHAYRRLARETHPDVSTDPLAMDRFVALADAYRVASQPPAAESFDVVLAAPGPSVRPGRGEASPDRSTRVRGFWISTSLAGAAPGPPIVAGPVMVRPAPSAPDRGVRRG
ncbi:J domain-containing protein [Nocardioides guangzhouensis]